ncbi:hypothetical protein GS534_00955 [Rhodococcus hoagii]|nr:hypothetical protein [Prescottella equi]
MPAYTRGTTTIKRREWRLRTEPYGGAVAEVHKIVASAENQYYGDFNYRPHHDDWLRVTAEDDTIVFWYEIRESEGK